MSAPAPAPGRFHGTVTVAAARCKGCELCVIACPVDVLSMSTEVNDAGFRFPLLEPGCIACGLCHAVCPDYVFEVYRYQDDQPSEQPQDDPPAAAGPRPPPEDSA